MWVCVPSPMGALCPQHQIKVADGALAAAAAAAAASAEGKMVMVGTEGDPDNSEGVASQESVEEVCED